MKPTLREGEGSNTYIRGTPQFILCFPEVFQQVKTGIVAFTAPASCFFVVVVFVSFSPSSKGPIMVLEAILTSQQPHEKLLRLYDNLMSNNFCKTAVLKKNLNCKLTPNECTERV